MQVSYQLTQRDFYDSLIAIRNRKAWAKWCFRILPIALLALIVSSVAVTPHSQVISSLTPLLIFLLFWTFLLWGSPWLSVRKQFQQQPSAQGEHTVTLGEHEVSRTWNGGWSVVAWKNYIYWMETKTQFLLCSSPISCAIIPKRAVKGEEESLRALLTDKLGAGRRV